MFLAKSSSLSPMNGKTVEVITLVAHTAATGRKKSAHDLDKSRLARAVWTNQAVDGPGLERTKETSSNPCTPPNLRETPSMTSLFILPFFFQGRRSSP